MMRAPFIALARFIATASLSLSAAQATPIHYDAVFNVDSLHGAAPADWGSVGIGTSLNLSFTWDSDAAVQQTSTAWTGGPLSQYTMTLGNATLFSSTALEAGRFSGSTSVFIDDLKPVVCTQPVCAGGFGDWFVDDVLFNFRCADWSGTATLATNLECASGLTANTFFELFRPSNQPEFGISASLSGIQRASVPEPGSLALVLMGLAGMWFVRRKPGKPVLAA